MPPSSDELRRDLLHELMLNLGDQVPANQLALAFNQAWDRKIEPQLNPYEVSRDFPGLSSGSTQLPLLEAAPSA